MSVRICLIGECTVLFQAAPLEKLAGCCTGHICRDCHIAIGRAIRLGRARIYRIGIGETVQVTQLIISETQSFQHLFLRCADRIILIVLYFTGRRRIQLICIIGVRLHVIDTQLLVDLILCIGRFECILECHGRIRLITTEYGTICIISICLRIQLGAQALELGQYSVAVFVCHRTGRTIDSQTVRICQDILHICECSLSHIHPGLCILDIIAIILVDLAECRGQTQGFDRDQRVIRRLRDLFLRRHLCIQPVYRYFIIINICFRGIHHHTIRNSHHRRITSYTPVLVISRSYISDMICTTLEHRL